MRLAELIAAHPLILTEGAVIERLRRDPAVRLDPHVMHAGLLYEPAGRQRLTALYREYLEIAQAHDRPLLLGTPTWRASPERLERAGLGGRPVHRDAALLLRELRAATGAYAERVLIGGLLGCRGDAYRPDGALPADAAAAHHARQTCLLAESAVDFLWAATLPARSEALGLARALAATGRPYVLSFVVRSTGACLDGNPLDAVIREIDNAVSPAPIAYLGNCVHPAVFGAALAAMRARDAGAAGRVIGLQANTSALDPEELDGRPELDAMAPAAWADALLALHRERGIRVLGGCCGTDARHIAALAARCG